MEILNKIPPTLKPKLLPNQMKKCFKRLSRSLINTSLIHQKREDLYNLNVLFLFFYAFICIYILNEILVFVIPDSITPKPIIPLSAMIGAFVILIFVILLLKRHLRKLEFDKDDPSKYMLQFDIAKCGIYVVLSVIIMEGNLFQDSGTDNNIFEAGYWLSADFGLISLCVVSSLRTPVARIIPTIFWFIYSYLRLQSWKFEIINASFFALKILPVVFCLFMTHSTAEKISPQKAKQENRKFASKVLDLLPEGVAIVDASGLKYANQSLSTILRVKETQCLNVIKALENTDYIEALKNSIVPRRTVTMNAESDRKIHQPLNGAQSKDVTSQKEMREGPGVSSFNPDAKFNRSQKRSTTDRPYHKTPTDLSPPRIAFRKLKIENDETFRNFKKQEPAAKRHENSLYTITEKGSLLSPKGDDVKITFIDRAQSKISDDSLTQINKKDELKPDNITRINTTKNPSIYSEQSAPDTPTGVKSARLRLKQIIDKIQQPYQRSEHMTAGDAIQELLQKLGEQFAGEEVINSKTLQSVKNMEQQPLPSRKFISRSATFQNERRPKSKVTYYTLSRWATIMNSEREDLDNTIQRLEVKFTPFIAQGRPCLIILIRDITEIEVIKQMEEKERNQAQALAAVSHEFRTPLNGILGMLDTLKDKLTHDVSQNYLMPAYNSAKLLLTFVNDILDFHQLKEQKLNIVPIKFHLKSKLEDCLSLISIQARRKELQLTIDIDKRIPSYINNDPNRVQQVVNNLLGNAIKFTLNGSIIIFVEPHPSGRIQIKVQDTGIGIEAHNIEKLFKAFGKIDSEKNRELNPQGVGLGLTISNRIAECLCQDKRVGGLNVSSEYGKGSNFWFIIDDMLSTSDNCEMDEHYGRSLLENIEDLNNRRSSTKNKQLKDSTSLSKQAFTFLEGQTENQSYRARPMDDDSLRDALDEIVIEEKPFSSNVEALVGQEVVLTQLISTYKERTTSVPHLLMVDDNDINHLVFRGFISKFNFVINSAYDGRQAIQMMMQKKESQKHEQYTLVFMDIEMPIMGGLECAEKLKKMATEGEVHICPIIAQSGHDDQDQIKKCYAAGMVDYMIKPVSKSTLIDVLVKWLKKELEVLTDETGS